MSMTRTTARPTTGYCLVEHFEPQVELDDESGVEVKPGAPDINTQPLPVVNTYSREQLEQFEAIKTEVTKYLLQVLALKRFLGRSFFAKDLLVVNIPTNGYRFDVIRNNVSCSAMQTMLANKSLFREYLESAAKDACAKAGRMQFIQLTSHEVRTDTFVLEVGIA